MKNNGIEIFLAGQRVIDFISLKETIEKGQVIESFVIEVGVGDGWEEVYRASTIGYQRFCHFKAVRTNRVRIRILKSRGTVRLTEIGIYLTESVLF